MDVDIICWVLIDEGSLQGKKKKKKLFGSLFEDEDMKIHQHPFTYLPIYFSSYEGWNYNFFLADFKYQFLNLA